VIWTEGGVKVAWGRKPVGRACAAADPSKGREKKEFEVTRRRARQSLLEKEGGKRPGGKKKKKRQQGTFDNWRNSPFWGEWKTWARVNGRIESGQ